MRARCLQGTISIGTVVVFSIVFDLAIVTIGDHLGMYILAWLERPWVSTNPEQPPLST